MDTLQRQQGLVLPLLFEVIVGTTELALVGPALGYGQSPPQPIHARPA